VLIAGVAAAFAASAGVLSVVAAAVFLTHMLVPRGIPEVSATLILPATGPLLGLEALFDALSAQTLPPKRLLIAVESRDDPAYERVVDLAARYPDLAVELVVAGLSDQRAQKLTNLLAALARLDQSDDYVVLFDADIRPQAWWLAALIAPLVARRADIVNGYRWQLPRTISPASVIGAAIDRAIAVLPRPQRFRLLWGGSLALTRRALDAIDLPQTLARALTEDLVIADRATALGLRVLTRSALRLPTPLDDTLLELWRFTRRQYQIIHIYRRELWRFAFGVCSADLLARASLVAIAAAGGGLAARIAIAALIALGVLGSTAGAIRRAIGLRLGVIDPRGFAVAHHLAVWATLPIAAFEATALWASARRSPVRWRHIRYRIDGDGRVIAAVRSPHHRAPG